MITGRIYWSSAAALLACAAPAAKPAEAPEQPDPHEATLGPVNRQQRRARERAEAKRRR